MSATPRSVPLVLAALAVTIVAGCGSPKADAGAPAGTTSPGTHTPDATQTAQAPPSTMVSTPPTLAPTATIEVRGGKVVSGPRLVEVARGTRVVLLIRTDRADEVHVHGYDKLYQVTAAKPAQVAFTADIAGAFEVELHSGTLLCELRVR